MLTLPRWILICLQKANGLAVPEDSLHANAGVALPPGPTLLELRTELSRLEQAGWICGTRNRLDGPQSPVKWAITDSGRLELAKG